MATLVSIGYSPWSQKARWALDHHQVSYKNKPFTSIFGVPGLRAKMGKWRGKLTVPVFIDGSGVYDDSLAIARRAEAIGEGAPLFPAGKQADVVRWNAMGDALCDAGRALTTQATLGDPDALRTSMPPGLAKLPGALAVGRFGANHLRRKYTMSIQGAEDAMDVLLQQIDAALDGDYLLGSFSYADIAVAAALQMVKPVDHRAGKLADAAKPAWTRPALAEKHARVLRWRDQLYAEHR